MKTIRLPFKLKKPILAFGADLKSAFAFGAGDKAFLVDGFGDLSDPDNINRYEEAVKRYGRRLGIKPKIIACDLHPAYYSTRFAESYQLSAFSCQLFRVQHHEAHVASAIVDGSIKGDVIGVAFDGTGFGLDGNIWGGEFFVGGLKGLKRAAHLGYIRMPGGEAAIREPWRMAISYLKYSLGDRFLRSKIGFVRKLDKARCGVLTQMMARPINSPLTSSIGRLFDAVGSIVLEREAANFEAELPIILEDVAAQDCDELYDFDLRPDSGLRIIDVSRTIKGIVNDLSKKRDVSIISAKFHNTVAGMILKTSIYMRNRFKVGRVVLTGGVFQNSYLAGRTVIVLEKNGFEVYTHSNISTNDSGVPVGQIAIAGCPSRLQRNDWRSG